MTSQEQAEQNYQEALGLIERAQNLLSDACGKLCHLKGAMKEWEDCGKSYDNVHDLWRRIAYSSAKFNVEMDGL